LSNPTRHFIMPDMRILGVKERERHIERRMTEEERLSFISKLLTTLMNMMKDRRFIPEEKDYVINLLSEVYNHANSDYVLSSEAKMTMKGLVLSNMLNNSLSDISEKLEMTFVKWYKKKAVRFIRVFFILADDLVKSLDKLSIDKVITTIEGEVYSLSETQRSRPHEYIIILPSNLKNVTSFSSVNIRMLKERVNDGINRLTLFTASSLLSNPTRHFIMPDMRILGVKERERHIERMESISDDLRPEKYPKIKVNDIVVKYLGAKEGDILQVIDKKDFTVTSMSSKRWRIVTNVPRSVEEESLLMM